MTTFIYTNTELILNVTTLWFICFGVTYVAAKSTIPIPMLKFSFL